MAATAAVASSFSSSMQSIYYCNIRSSKKINWPSHVDPLLKIASISHSLIGNESISIAAPKWRFPRLAAAVAQEEAALIEETTNTTTVEAEEEDQRNAEEKEEVSSHTENSSSSSANTKLYFGNLPYHVDSAQLAGIIQDFGSPELVEVLYDRETGRSRGFAFVTMSTIEDCNAVIENLDGRDFGGRTLRVNFADKPKPKAPLYPETEYKIFVGNLAWSVTSETLTQAFQEYGNVVGARVLYDGDSGRSRGYGFVCYETKAEMDTALESLNGVELEGRPMRVSLAEGKKR